MHYKTLTRSDQLQPSVLFHYNVRILEKGCLIPESFSLIDYP